MVTSSSPLIQDLVLVIDCETFHASIIDRSLTCVFCQLALVRSLWKWGREGSAFRDVMGCPLLISRACNLQNRGSKRGEAEMLASKWAKNKILQNFAVIGKRLAVSQSAEWKRR